MMDWLPTLERVQPWHWWVLGSILLILEVAAPGVFFVWLALSAFSVGLIVFVLPMPVVLQLLLFGGFSLAAVLLGRRYVGRLPVGGEEGDNLNLGAHRFTGRTVTVTTAIENGIGRVRVGDSDWRATGPDAPAGSRVRVVGADGSTVQVVPEALLEGVK
ncbi:NfeD family protein [Deinococcus puniceus]|uniref:Membrane protein n=1 Tax=Deinococcus puniceus TaxID=1182568 RepID=A0A172T7A9_9DEIO|nr:NfeD family protein [Deinococcus puniceus]ANE42918.1 membrane protein [Deinococcus puniceus]